MFPRSVLVLFLCAVFGYLIGRAKGHALLGLSLGAAFGPIGLGLLLFMPAAGRARADSAEGPSRSGRETYRTVHPQDREPSRGSPGSRSAENPRAGVDACPRCGRPVPGGAKACPGCGNVLMAIRYQVHSPRDR